MECRQDASGKITWYLYDGLGSVIAEVDTGANVTATRSYDVYGSVRDSSGSSYMEHEFCGGLGHTTEPETGNLICMRARWVDPVTGRFLSEDPGKNGNDWYVYCQDNPVTMFDATGKDATDGFLALDKLLATDIAGYGPWAAEKVLEMFNSMVQDAVRDAAIGVIGDAFGPAGEDCAEAIKEVLSAVGTLQDGIEIGSALTTEVALCNARELLWMAFLDD